MNVAALHVDVLWPVRTGVGFTVTVTVNAAPLQLPAVGVTLYVAVTEFVVTLVNSPLRSVWADAANPPERPTLNVGVLQAYVVPAGMIVPVGV